MVGGAATVCAAALAIAKLKLPYVSFEKKERIRLNIIRYIRVNLIVLTPLTENMPGSANKPDASANKPGDM